jgi:hypothetical protein
MAISPPNLPTSAEPHDLQRIQRIATSRFSDDDSTHFNVDAVVLAVWKYAIPRDVSIEIVVFPESPRAQCSVEARFALPPTKQSAYPHAVKVLDRDESL